MNFPRQLNKRIRSTMAVVISALRNDYLVDGWSTGKSSTTLRKTLVAKSC